MTVVRLWIDGQRLNVRSPYQLKETLKGLGGRWNATHLAWTFPATPSAAKTVVDELQGFWAVDVAPDVAELLAAAEAEAATAVHKTADDLPEIPGRLASWLHQRQAYHFAFERRFTMLDMWMGAGKSKVAISLLDGRGADLAVILCPRSVMRVWPNQFRTHSERTWTVLVPPANQTVAKRVEYLRRQLLVARGPVAIALNYEAAWRKPMAEFLRDLAAKRRPRLILDESHRIKAPGGTASKFVAGLAKHCAGVEELTGTPMPHSPMDVYAQYRAGDPGIFGTSFHAHRHRYCLMGGFEGRQVVAYQREEEFAAKFASAAFIFSKEDLAKLGLSPGDAVHMDRPVELDARTRKAYDILDADFTLSVEGGTVTVANALVKLIRLQQVTSGYVRDDDGIDREVGDDKLKVLADVLEDLAVDEPLVIFARFKHDLAAIAALCRGTGRRVGVVSGDVREGDADYGLNEHSQMRDDIDVCLLQLQSGGVGIDLTRAATAIYFSLDFSLGNFDQSLSRVDRPGQTRPVTFIHLIATATKDEIVYQALQERRDVVDAVIASARRRLDEAA